MRETVLTIPELVLIAGTRAAFGAGLGLLLSERLSPDARNGAGWALVAVGALTTVPLLVAVLTKAEVEQKADDHMVGEAPMRSDALSDPRLTPSDGGG